MMDLVSDHSLRFILALALVLGLVAFFAWLAKRFRFGSFVGAGSSSARLQVVESLALDPRRRLLIIRRDQQEHLLLLGPETGLVIETGFSGYSEQEIPHQAADIGKRQ
ncbi:MAG: flagellar biosynthetic protein FliO [Geminicoccales bacterium]